jgi:uncharacterized cupredoxin-like copper-binding protein
LEHLTMTRADRVPSDTVAVGGMRCAMVKRRSVPSILAAVAAIIAACAPAGDQGPTVGQEARVVELSISADARFTPDRIAVQAGETIRFVVENPTSSDHELFIGSAAEQEVHHAKHLGLPVVEQASMSHFGYGIFLPAFGDGVLESHFAAPGEVLIGCHLPGHYEGGHVATVVVSP